MLSVSVSSGEQNEELKLDALPVWDGMAVADGSLFVRDGTECRREQCRRRLGSLGSLHLSHFLLPAESAHHLLAHAVRHDRHADFLHRNVVK